MHIGICGFLEAASAGILQVDSERHSILKGHRRITKNKLERAYFMSEFELEMYRFRNNRAQTFLLRVYKS